MYGANDAESTGGESERTAFRQAEKRYKLFKSQPQKSRVRPVLNKIDLSDVVDFRSVLESFERCGETPPGIYKLDCPGFTRPVFCFDDRPGFYFIPSALTIEEQCHWIRKSLINFPQPPNRTNLTEIYGPLANLFNAARSEKIFVGVKDSGTCLEDGLSSGQNNMLQYRYILSDANLSTQTRGASKQVAASVLLRKMRWSTLGLQFDWCKRNYDVSLPHNMIPDDLCLLAKNMAMPAMPYGEEFQPEAAIVNYFGPSDMLGGHLDDMEADWIKPIVSISLGCKAIFLLGGRSRENIPVAMFLRSGDIVLMAGQARECFHGVPRIFTDNEHSEVSALIAQLSNEDDQCFVDYMKNSRININIRQVY